MEDSDYNLNFDLNFDIWTDLSDEEEVEQQTDDQRGQNQNIAQQQTTNDELRPENSSISTPSRFVSLTEEEIQVLASERNAQSTKFATNWGVKIFKSE